MENSSSKAYEQSGVDITSGYKAVELMQKYVQATLLDGAKIDKGGYGLFELPSNYTHPVLVSGTDGVGTKLKLAFILEKYDTVGIDCVAMCVNDILRLGARPIIFLDYIACGKNQPEVVANLVKGVSKGCIDSYASLVGGETAEMPGFYKEGEYDLAGFSVGIVEKDKIIDGSKLKEGDVLIGLASSGVHSNGFSLVRKVFDIDNKSKDELLKPVAELGGKSLGEVLLEPTKIYVKPVLELLKEVEVHTISHITGGGYYEKLARSIPKGLKGVIYKDEIEVLDIFKYIQKVGNISIHDMFNTFNMGVGMVLAVDKKDVEKTIEILKNNNQKAYCIGQIEKSDKEKVEVR